MSFLAHKVSGGKGKHNIARYCRWLGISRQVFYKFMKPSQKPWKHEAIAQEIRSIVDEDVWNDNYGTIAEFMENGLESEQDDSLGYGKYDYKNQNTDNSRNGHSHKNLRTSFGDVEISVPRDRKGEFEPQLIKKNQTSISQNIEDKIVSMYAKGMSTSDIESHIQDIYGLSVSDTTISRITDKLLPLAREWQQRPLESLYAVVLMDAIHYHVRSEGQIVKKAVYIAIGINLDGRKDVLGMWVGENESANSGPAF